MGGVLVFDGIEQYYSTGVASRTAYAMLSSGATYDGDDADEDSSCSPACSDVGGFTS